MIAQLLLWTLLISGTIYAGFIVYLHSGMSQLDPPAPSRNLRFTVLVVAHNEAEQIAACVESLLGQDYPENLLEIILIDDRSADGTGDIMKRYGEQFDHIRVLHIAKTPPAFSPKKYALTQGIAAATGEWILTTDADCQPPSTWLSKTASYVSPGTEMIIGPAPLQPNGTFISKMSALDALAADSIAAGTAGWNMAIQSTGRNFGYQKQLLQEIDGYQGIEQILSGDDTLLLQKARRQAKCRAVYIADPDVAVPSPAPELFMDRVHQRRRHVSGSLYFPRRVKTGYFLFYLSNSVLWIGCGIALFSPLPVLLPLSLLLIKFLLDFSLLRRSAHHSKQHALLKWFLPWELFYFLEQITISPLGLLGKTRW